jgi:hypothetical protein
MTPTPNVRHIATAEIVTRAELVAHLEPMKDDIREIKGDVKALIEDRAEHAWLGERGRRVIAGVSSKLAIATAGALASAAITLAITYL